MGVLPVLGNASTKLTPPAINIIAFQNIEDRHKEKFYLPKMGFVLPSPNSPPERARALMDRKDLIQAELDAQFSILSVNRSTMHSPLVDTEGFPRADIDVYAVRHARVRIIELRNDMQAIMDDIGKALEGVYNPNAVSSSGSAIPLTTLSSRSPSTVEDELHAFAKVDGVAPDKPLDSAILTRLKQFSAMNKLKKIAYREKEQTLRFKARY